MENTFIVIGAISSIVLVLSCALLYKYSAFLHRSSLDGDQLYRLFDVRSKKKFDQLITKVSESYGVPSSKLRPSDSLHGNLKNLDIWNLGSGVEELEDFVRELIPPECHQNLGKVHSLGDLAKLIDCDGKCPDGDA